MIDADLAARLRTAGLPWRPASGDRFTIPSGDFQGEVFVVAEMTIDVQDVPGGSSVFKFNGTTEWALDSVDAARVLWLPREDQLRAQLGDAFNQEVERRYGEDALETLWADPTRMPSAAELRDPTAWAARVLLDGWT